MEQDEVKSVLRRIFKGGPLRRIPKKREDAEIALALSLTGLDFDGIYDESDINVQLSAWLEGIAVENSAADYVALRRDLVDSGFLRRSTDGAIYRIEQARVQQLLTPDAMQINPKEVLEEVETARDARRENFR